jgi:hypothetical protein
MCQACYHGAKNVFPVRLTHQSRETCPIGEYMELAEHNLGSSKLSVKPRPSQRRKPAANRIVVALAESAGGPLGPETGSGSLLCRRASWACGVQLLSRKWRQNSSITAEAGQRELLGRQRPMRLCIYIHQIYNLMAVPRCLQVGQSRGASRCMLWLISTRLRHRLRLSYGT